MASAVRLSSLPDLAKRLLQQIFRSYVNEVFLFFFFFPPGHVKRYVGGFQRNDGYLCSARTRRNACATGRLLSSSTESSENLS